MSLLDHTLENQKHPQISPRNSLLVIFSQWSTGFAGILYFLHSVRGNIPSERETKRQSSVTWKLEFHLSWPHLWGNPSEFSVATVWAQAPCWEPSRHAGDWGREWERVRSSRCPSAGDKCPSVVSWCRTQKTASVQKPKRQRLGYLLRPKPYFPLC